MAHLTLTRTPLTDWHWLSGNDGDMAGFSRLGRQMSKLQKFWGLEVGKPKDLIFGWLRWSEGQRFWDLISQDCWDYWKSSRPANILEWWMGPRLFKSPVGLSHPFANITFFFNNAWNLTVLMCEIPKQWVEPTSLCDCRRTNDSAHGRWTTPPTIQPQTTTKGRIGR